MKVHRNPSARSPSRWLLVLLSCGIGLGGFAHAAKKAIPKVDSRQLLETSDRARGALKKGAEWDLSIETTEDGDKSERSFHIKALENNAVSEATAPARNQGEIFLFNGPTMWFTRPGLKKPVSISARQKLSGQTSSGDIAATHYSRDYIATAAGQENVDGKPCWVLSLKAKNPQVTYDLIKYWISVKDKVGIKAEFLSLQGKVLKTARLEYGNSFKSGGQTFPFISRIEITDAKNPANRSVLSYANPVERSLSAATFDLNSLGQ